MNRNTSYNSLVSLSRRGSVLSSADFKMHEVDISRNYGHGTIPVPGRESHTADLNEFDRYIQIMREGERLSSDLPWEDDNNYNSDDDDDEQYSDSSAAEWAAEQQQQQPAVVVAHGATARAAAGCMKSPSCRGDANNNINDDIPVEVPLNDLKLEDNKDDDEKQQQHIQQQHQYPFNSEFWSFIRSILAKAIPVGYNELEDSNETISKGPNDANAFLSKVIAISLLNPIQPASLAAEGQFDEMDVLAELLYATSVGLVSMRFAPECVQCGSAVMDTDILGRIKPGRMNCNGCHALNVVDSLDNIKVMFCLNSDVLYVLAENYACTPSAKSMGETSVFAAVPATSTGSGFSYSIGTGKETEIAPALPAGRYRMHCPVAKTDNFLVVKRDVVETDTPIKLKMKVSQLVCKYSKRGTCDTKKATLEVPHGMIEFAILPDTRSFFVLWVQNDVDDDVLMHLPQDERSGYTSAAVVMHHPVFNALFQEHHVVAAPTDVFLSISNVVLVFTDIVDSTKLYAALGDGEAFQLVRKHFQVLFGAFTESGGRVVKTIGDAVMASFPNGKTAMEAVAKAMEMLPTIGRRPDNDNYIEIRVGIHCGRATIVPLNGVNDYFGQTTNIAARVQSSAKSSECFVTEAVLESNSGAMEVYEEITKDGSSFQATPKVLLKLKGVEGKVVARGFRWTQRSRRQSEMSDSYDSRRSYIMNRLGHRPGARVEFDAASGRQSFRSSVKSESELSDISSNDYVEELPPTKMYERPAAMGKRRSSNLEKHDEEED